MGVVQRNGVCRQGATGSWAWRGWGSARAQGRRGKQFAFTAGGEEGLQGALLVIALFATGDDRGMDNRYEWNDKSGNRGWSVRANLVEGRLSG